MSIYKRKTYYGKKKAAKVKKAKWQDYLLATAFFIFLVFLVYL